VTETDWAHQGRSIGEDGGAKGWSAGTTSITCALLEQLPETRRTLGDDRYRSRGLVSRDARRSAMR